MDNPNRVPEAVVEAFASVVCPLPRARLAPHVNRDPLNPESFVVRDEVPEAIFEFVLDTERTIESFMFEELRKFSTMSRSGRNGRLNSRRIQTCRRLFVIELYAAASLYLDTAFQTDWF